MNELERVMSKYKRHGGKRWRSEQVDKLAKFLAFSERHSLKQIGSKQVIAFYVHLREKGRSHKTQMAYFYAIKAGYEAIGRTKEPPRPRA